jgi:ATP-dependent helicase/nuclease subunit A
MSTLLPPRAAATGAPPAPHELFLASAGSGKTYQLSSRIIALLAYGAPPEQVLASTFTRKAAGEILDRVLRRIAEAALDPGAAGKLAEDAALEGVPPPQTHPDDWARLLHELVRRLHRFAIGTLDAYFVGAARAFGHELELPPGWGIADEAAMARLRSEALQEVLATADAAELAGLLKLVRKGEVRRSVHEHLLDDLGGLLEIHEAIDPGVPDPWGAFAADAPPLPPGESGRVAAAIRALPVPPTQKGAPDSRWRRALDRAADAVEAGDWAALTAGGLCGKLLAGEDLYYGHPLSAETHPALREALDVAAAVLRPRLAEQVRALGDLTARYATALRALQYRRGAYRFGDLTRLVGGPGALLARPELYYRLDSVARHLLLDEFQDTSRAQWEALQPLFDEAVQDQERAAVVVADPKQSIYGWRGAEPRVVHALKEHYSLTPRTLARSWRSSRVVLDFVNDVFTGLASNALLEEDEVCRQAAAQWSQDFTRHVHARELPGYVAVEVGPRDSGQSTRRPLLCRRAAERVRELCDSAPGYGIGVLTRKNSGVARMIMELRRMGVDASEEGGNPLTDAAAVEAVLALLRMADHPGDAVARYHVAHTPLGAALGFTDPADTDALHRLTRKVRAALLQEGYGRVIDRWTRAVEGECSARDRRRLRQLVEVAYRYEDRASLRPADFVRVVESERVESPARARVRVMTVHQAKGLEFDIVVLPELDDLLFRARNPPALAWRDEPGGRVTAVYPSASEEVRCLFPELQAAHHQARQAGLRDGLSGLYVALTRARYALHLVIRADDEKGQAGSSLSAAGLVRSALGLHQPAVEGRLLHESGDPRWHRTGDAPPGEVRSASDAGEGIRIRLLSDADRRRILPRRTPSGLEGGARVDLSSILRLDTRAALDRGSVLHRWFEAVEWLDEGVPPEDELRRLAREVAPAWGEEQLRPALASFAAALAAPPIAAALGRAAYPAGAAVEREVPFVWRRPDGAGLLEGVVDRLVVIPDADGRAQAAEVLDFKTDDVAGNRALLRQRTLHYTPQIHAYRAAVAGMYGLPPERVEGRLLFVEAGEVVTLT